MAKLNRVRKKLRLRYIRFQPEVDRSRDHRSRDLGVTINQKRVQKVLEERGVQPIGELNLSCPKPKCFNCRVAAKCKICVREHKYNICKLPCQCSFTICSKTKRCDACLHEKEICQCVSKKYYIICSVKKEKCEDYEDLPFKCATDGN